MTLIDSSDDHADVPSHCLRGVVEPVAEPQETSKAKAACYAPAFTCVMCLQRLMLERKKLAKQHPEIQSKTTYYRVHATIRTPCSARVLSLILYGGDQRGISTRSCML